MPSADHVAVTKLPVRAARLDDVVLVHVDGVAAAGLIDRIWAMRKYCRHYGEPVDIEINLVEHSILETGSKPVSGT